MYDRTSAHTRKYAYKFARQARVIALFLCILLLAMTYGCAANPEETVENKPVTIAGSPRLALWLAKKGELIDHDSASFDLVMTGWLEPEEAANIRARNPSTDLLAGLSLNWIASDPGWQSFLVTVANGGDPDGPYQITEDMFLKYDDDGDGILDRRCTFPGWEGPEIYAMDPRHAGWQALIMSFYDVVASQAQHDGVIVDMVDAYAFCEGSWSEGVPVPLDSAAWVSGQEQLLRMLRDSIPAEKWIIANAGCGFPADSPFPQYLNGYLLENALGTLCRMNLEELLAAGNRALQSTNPPQYVVYAVDTDDTGAIDWPRFRNGLVASLLMDHTYFAFDFGPLDHGGVKDYWFPEYYDVMLGDPTAAYSQDSAGYRRDFERGLIVAAVNSPFTLLLDIPHTDITTGVSGTEFTVPQGDARIFLIDDE